MLGIWQQFLDAFDIRNESHVKHTVCFIKYQHFDVLKVYGSLLAQVQQTAWSRDKYVDSLAQFLDLRSYLDATKYSK